MCWEERGEGRSWSRCLVWVFEPGFYLPVASASALLLAALPCPPHCLLPAHFTPATPPPPITVLTDFSSTVFTVLERYQRPKSCPTGLIHCLKWIKRKDALIIFIMKAYKIQMLYCEGFSLVLMCPIYNQYRGWMIVSHSKLISSPSILLTGAVAKMYQQIYFHSKSKLCALC